MFETAFSVSVSFFSLNLQVDEMLAMLFFQFNAIKSLRFFLIQSSVVLTKERIGKLESFIYNKNEINYINK